MSLGTLLGISMGQRALTGMENQKRYDQQAAMKQEEMKRANPTFTEQLNDLAAAKNADPSAVNLLGMLKGVQNPDLIQAQIDLAKAGANKANAEAKNYTDSGGLTPALQQKKKDVENQKQGLLNNLDEIQKTLEKINAGNTTSLTQGSGPISGRIASAEAAFGQGANKDDISMLQSLITGTKLQYGKDFSGRYNNAEGAEIEAKLLPILNLPPSQQLAALKGARILVQNKFLGGQGADESGEVAPGLDPGSNKSSQMPPELAAALKAQGL